MSPLAPFGSQPGELDSCEIALALARSKKQRVEAERRREAQRAKRAARIQALKRRLGMV